MKRLFSKRSGFTLVEIIVAFAVFAIMAAIIVQMMGLVVSQRLSNNEYARSLEDQQENLITKDKSDTDKINDSNKTGDLSIKLTDKDDGSVLDITMPYEMRSADGTKGDANGLNYFLSNVEYDSDGTGTTGGSGGSGGGGSSTGSQTSRLDTRITGTKGFEQITVREVSKDPDTDGLESGQTRYLFRVSAMTGDSFADEDIPYAQYRLFFYDSVKLDTDASSKKYTDDKGKEYTKNVYAPAQIVEVGYLDENTSEYTVEKMGTNVVRIGTPFTPDEGVEFEYHKFSQFYVIFDGDPKLTVESFGDNGKTEDGDQIYKHEDVEPDNPSDIVSPNIYGAFQYERVYS